MKSGMHNKNKEYKLPVTPSWKAPNQLAWLLGSK